MTELELFVSEQIKTLVPNYEALELKATVSSSSFSVEFFATVDGKKMQCFEMMQVCSPKRISMSYQKLLRITAED